MKRPVSTNKFILLFWELMQVILTQSTNLISFNACINKCNLLPRSEYHISLLKNVKTKTKFLSEPQKRERQSFDSIHFKNFKRKWL